MQINFLEISLRFLIAGLVVIGVWLLTKFINPKIAGAIAVMPSVFSLAYIFAFAGSKDVAAMNKFVVGGMYGVFAWLVFLPTLYFLNTRLSFWAAFGIAFVVWFLAAFLFNSLKINF
jgi:uncharacterized membrane protein (GlpM family)